jgi:F0F1-type ATP synthase assembly protein I
MASPDDNRRQMVFGMALASAVSQIGCVTLVVVLGALAAGLWLDKTLDTRPLLTILFMLVSVPISLYLLVRIALSAAAQVTPPPKPPEKKEANHQDAQTPRA